MHTVTVFNTTEKTYLETEIYLKNNNYNVVYNSNWIDRKKK